MSSILTWLALLGPVLLLLTGLVPTRAANHRPAPMRFAVLAAAVAAAGLAAIIAGVLLLSGEAVRGGFILLEAVSATILLLVANVGAVVISYSCHYLDGDPGQGRFMRAMALLPPSPRRLRSCYRDCWLAGLVVGRRAGLAASPLTQPRFSA